MPAMAIEMQTRQWATELEDRERARSRTPLITARRAVANRVGVPAGTLENIRRGRSKGVRAWVAEKIRSAIVAEMEREVERLTHEIFLALQGAPGTDPIHSRAIKAQIAVLKSLIKEGAGR